MNLDKLFTWIIGIVLTFVLAGQLDILQTWIWRAQAQVIYKSRSSNWVSPRFFKDQNMSKISAQRKVAHKNP